ncbi:unnamed protein product [Allacma fusca]|uniref:Kinesin-like protein n=1 Tax=Allacma fusca TaxID=39272 RepID=A0A8J2LB33_9HEXA|nr:unnamed protein product [Allacma fusca]
MATSSSVQRAIKIYARVKPSVHRQTTAYDIIGSGTTEEEVLTIAVKQNPEDGYINNKPEQHSFRFSKVFDRKCTQDDVFQDVAKPVIDSALLGYNGTIFAYGQTGSGKTFTMTGSRAEYDKRGIIPRTLSHVFRTFHQDSDSSKIRAAFVSYLEIYNEGGYDLLHSSDMAGRLEDLGKVTLLEDGHQQMHLRNLSVHPINSEEEALQLLYLGDHNRTVAETPLNEASTRSHCIFTIHLNIRETNTSIVRRSKLHLVDLAGSERVSNSPISGQLLTEARHINLALHYLEQVIVALSDSNRQHIPYRNSMMTSVLRDSLGGNCMTSMIATLSLEPGNVMESLSTCRFSQRVAQVTNAAMPNEELDPNLVIQQLKAEVKKLRDTIASPTMKTIHESSLPVSKREYQDCCELVERFLQNPDPNAALPVPPEMRLIQTCFRLLRSASSKKKSDSSPFLQFSTMLQDKSVSSGNRNQADMSPQELLQTINRRDIEIKVLVEMLRKEKQRRGTSGNPEISSPNSASSSYLFANEGKASGSTDARCNLESIAENAGDELLDMSDVKKLALSEFLETYEERDKLEAIRAEILKKRDELESLETTINSNELNIGSLSDIYNRTKEEGLSEESENIRSALESQERTYALQIKRRQNARRELDAKHEILKAIYHKLMLQFEDWWQSAAARDAGEDPDGPSSSCYSGTCSTHNQSSLKQQEGTGMPFRFREDGTANGPFAPLDGGSLHSSDDHNHNHVGMPELISKPSRGTEIKQCDRMVTAPAPPPSPWSGPNDLLDGDLTGCERLVSSPEKLEEDDEDTPSILLTGDPSTDEEILKFFEARKMAVTKIKLQAC